MSMVTLKCLSIRQPWADLIMSGDKKVENRTWTWMKERNWKQEGPVLLGIHASSNLAEMSEEEERDFWPGDDEKDIGCLLGVVDLVMICRPRQLPTDLRHHRHAVKDAHNWCWVLRNPRRFAEPIDAVGNARLFHVDVPDELLR